jgi:hypothetical protein
MYNNPTVDDHPALHQYVRHRSYHSLGRCEAVTLHSEMSTDAPYDTIQTPCLDVEITDRARGSHHKDGDHVIWAAKDCRW